MRDRRQSPRHAVILPALCTKRNGAEFHAVTVDMSAEGLRLRSATLPRSDETITCNIRGIGAIEVRVAVVGACDFAVRVISRDPTPGEVARRLIELARQQASQADVARVSRRIVPARTAVQITLQDGTGAGATILNLSASGAALRLDIPLTLGDLIVVGQRRAEVARLIEGGVGVAFLEPLDDGAVGEHTVL